MTDFIMPKGKKLKKSHSDRCSICKHDGCLEIEKQFVLGRAVTGSDSIESNFGVSSSSLYRHMEARELTASRKDNPLGLMWYAIEKHIGNVDFRGADMLKGLETIAKSQGKLGPDSQVNIQQNLGTFVDKLAQMEEKDVDAAISEILNGTGH